MAAPTAVAAGAAFVADRRLAELGVLVIMVFWAGNFIVVKGAIGILPPVGFTFLRYVLASVTLLALLRWRTGTIRLPHGDILAIGLLGVVGFGCYQVLWPVDPTFLGEAIRPAQVIGGVVILAGVSLLRRGAWPGRRTARALGNAA